ncbi:methyltransferase [Pseudonocardia sp. CA-142604]|uniref:methyltransferase n=1 Tax=Pseudonocardia sp. CA-142604 TaxID=3240024 RepID=UPI003D8C0B8D
MSEVDPSDDVLSHASRLLEIVNASWMTQATRVAAELGLPDLIAAGRCTADDLAAATNTHAPSLHRLLRALVTLDICRENADGTFELTPMGELLRTDADGTVRSWTIYWGREVWPEWAHLLESVTTGRSARELVSGSAHFDPLRDDPARAAIFNSAMAENTRLATRSIVTGYDFSATSRIVDVGGGYGELLAAVLTANPSVEGVLFDLPHAIEKAGPYLEKCGVADRSTLLSGNFFEELPADADAYMLKHVLHDWDDEHSHDILTTCRRAMTGSSKLLVIERLVPEVMEPSPEHRLLARADLHMLVAHAALERTELQFRDLLGSAGFTISKVMPLAMGNSLIEAVPAQQ